MRRPHVTAGDGDAYQRAVERHHAPVLRSLGGTATVVAAR
jgi:hypothetical protein